MVAEDVEEVFVGSVEATVVIVEAEEAETSIVGHHVETLVHHLREYRCCA